MTITKEVNAYDVIENAWSGAKDRLNDLTIDEVKTVLSTLEDCYPEGMSETELNDFFWFEDDTYAEWLGYRDAEHLWTAKEHEGERLFYDGCSYVTEKEAQKQFADYLEDCKANEEEPDFETWEEFAEDTFEEVEAA